MRETINPSKLLAAGLTTVAMLFGSGSAYAGDSCQPCYSYKTVTVYVKVKKPYVCYCVKYDHCGEPYLTKVVKYKTICVPVKKQIKVCR